MASDGWMRTETSNGALTVVAGGAWTVNVSASLDGLVKVLRPGDARQIVFDLSAVDRLDSAGAWLLFRTVSRLRGDGIDVSFHGVAQHHQPLLNIVADSDRPAMEESPDANAFIRLLDRTGRGAFATGHKGIELLNFIGVVTTVSLRTIRSPGRLRPKALVTQIEQTGLNALPIVGLLTFFVGVVLA